MGTAIPSLEFRRYATSRRDAAAGGVMGTLIPLLLLGAGCRPPAAGWGRVTVVESRLGPSSWSVVVDDRGQGADLMVDGSRRQAQCRRTSQGLRCWVGGLREGFRRLAVQVGGRGTARRTALSGPPTPADLVLYHVVLDRFADGDPGNNVRVRREDPAAPHGGDLVGLRAQLPFLKSLGVNGILVSPLWDHVRTGAGPGKLPAWIGQVPRSDAAAERLAPALGSPPELMRLLSGARRRGIRVVLDLPRPAGWALGRYFEVVRGWVSRTFVDGVRLGPPAPGELDAWARETQALADAFAPLLVLHRPGGQGALLARALAGAPAAARVLEDRASGAALLAWLGCPGGGGALGPALRAGSGARARFLSDVRRPRLAGRCLVPGKGTVAAEWAEKTAALALTAHLLFAEIPVVFYADGLGGIGPTASLPDLSWPGVARSPRHRLIQRVLTLRRRVATLRRGTQQTRLLGDTLLLIRRLGACRVVVAIHRGTRTQRLAIPLVELGWPAGQGGPGATVELVDRLSGRGITAEKGLLTFELEPGSVSVLVPAGQDACRG